MFLYISALKITTFIYTAKKNWFLFRTLMEKCQRRMATTKEITKLEEHDQKWNGKQGKERCEESNFGNECGVLAVTQAKNSAVGSHRHSNNHGVDVHHKRRESNGTTYIVDSQRQYGKTQECGSVNCAVT